MKVRVWLSLALHGRTYTRIGSIEEETYNHQDASTGYRRHNPQGNPPTLKHRLNLLQPSSVNECSQHSLGNRDALSLISLTEAS